MSGDAADSDSRPAHQIALSQAIRAGIMTLARITFSYLWQRRLSTSLNVALLAFGVAAVTLLLLSSAQLEERSEEHTSELQSLMRNSYAVFCLKKKNNYIYT